MRPLRDIPQERKERVVVEPNPGKPWALDLLPAFGLLIFERKATKEEKTRKLSGYCIGYVLYW